MERFQAAGVSLTISGIFFDTETFRAKSGLCKIGSLYYYFEPSTFQMQTGWQTLNGRKCYFRSNGGMALGLTQIDQDLYYFDPTSGYALNGWRLIDNIWYFFDSNTFQALKGFNKLGTLYYYFDPASSQMQTGWQILNGKKYYFRSNGGMALGLTQVGETFYYFDPGSGAALSGWRLLENTWYYFDTKTFEALRGFQKLGTCVYYFDPDTGKMLEGLQMIDQNPYRFRSNGSVLYGPGIVDGKLYASDPSTGILQTGWQEYNGSWYYFLSDTYTAATGFQTIGRHTFFFDDSGIMQVGWHRINNETYYFDHNGIMTVGTVILDGISYTFSQSGKLIPQDRWQVTSYADLGGRQSTFYTLYRETDGYLIVIDGGTRANEAQVRQVLKNYGNHVNLWFTTHYHDDHIGAFNRIFQNPGDLKIDRVLYSPMNPDEYFDVAKWYDSPEYYQEFLSVTNKDPRMLPVLRGQSVRLGSMTIQCLNSYDTAFQDPALRSDIPNDAALVLKFTGPVSSLLLLSDTHSPAMENLLMANGESTLHASYVQAGHHGINSYSENFYSSLNPGALIFDCPESMRLSPEYSARFLSDWCIRNQVTILDQSSQALRFLL